MDGLKGQIDGLKWMIGLWLALTVPTLATLIAPRSPLRRLSHAGSERPQSRSTSS